MANLFGFPIQSPRERVILIDGYVQVGASGFIQAGDGYTDASGVILPLPRGVTSIVRSSAGLFVITLEKGYVTLLSCSICPVNPTSAEVLAGALVSFNVTENAQGSVAAKTITVQLVNGSGVATDPETGGGFLIGLRLLNSTVGR